MNIEPKLKYAKLLNALSDMQHNPYYATRKGELREAELAIVELEQQLRDCRRKTLEDATNAVTDVSCEFGMYAASVRGASEGNYETRTEFMEGWNASCFEYQKSVFQAVQELLDKEPK